MSGDKEVLLQNQGERLEPGVAVRRGLCLEVELEPGARIELVLTPVDTSAQTVRIAVSGVCSAERVRRHDLGWVNLIVVALFTIGPVVQELSESDPRLTEAGMRQPDFAAQYLEARLDSSVSAPVAATSGSATLQPVPVAQTPARAFASEVIDLVARQLPLEGRPLWTLFQPRLVTEITSATSQTFRPLQRLSAEQSPPPALPQSCGPLCRAGYLPPAPDDKRIEMGRKALHLALYSLEVRTLPEADYLRGRECWTRKFWRELPFSGPPEGVDWLVIRAELAGPEGVVEDWDTPFAGLIVSVLVTEEAVGVPYTGCALQELSKLRMPFAGERKSVFIGIPIQAANPRHGERAWVHWWKVWSERWTVDAQSEAVHTALGGLSGISAPE